MAGRNNKPRAVAFVDFEHWYISLDKMYSKKPDLKEWRDKMSGAYNVREVLVFADFSNQALRAEIPKIREVTNYIIETQNAAAYVKKDYTDFIMLDHIYQKALSSQDIQVFIIFSGDGHFSSVASFLKNQCGKTVGVYGIRNAVSGQLKNTANWCVELPEERKEEANKKTYAMILKNLKYLETNNRGKKKLYPTFWGTVEGVAVYYNVSRDTVAKALRELIDRHFIYQADEKIDAKKNIKVLKVNWALAAGEGIYED